MSGPKAFSLVLVLLLFSSELLARRGGMGGFSRGASWGRRSFSSSRTGRLSRSIPSRGARAGRSAASRAKSRAGSTGYYQKARQNNTVFSSRQQASQAFEKRYRDSFPNRFTQQPSARPTYIPAQTTLSSGQSVPVFFNPSFGGYGYRDPLSGGFIAYSVFRDAVMLDLLMRRSNYYYGPPPPPVAATNSGGFLSLAIWLLVIFAAVNIIAQVSSRRRRR